MDSGVKPPAASSDEGNSASEELSGASSTTHVVQIQVVDAAPRPPLSRSPSLTLSEATPRTHRSTISPISPYFQVHEPLSGYQSDREAIVYKPDSATIQETHMLRNEGVRDVYYTEEHWSSIVKSYVTNAPPKFKQVIKAYRVKSTDKLTLFVEVASQPPALFQWFCNDRPANSAGIDDASPSQKRFTVHHGTNLSTLTVESPDQGVYSCSAQNPAGVSRSYGYITIDDSQSYKEVESMTEQLTLTALTPQTQPSKKRKAPKFLSQIPHFVLKPSEEALIDVEVDDAAAPVKFTWFVDGRQIPDGDENVVFYSPKPSRSVAQFRFPSSGQYTVVAQNQYGASKSTGFIEVQTDPSVDTHLYLLQPAVSALPPSSGALSPAGAAASRGRSVTKRTVSTTTFVHRSSSLPRTEFPEGDEIAKLLRRSQTPERTAEVQSEGLLQRQLSGGRPQAPIFVAGLPSEIILTPSERLVLSIEVSAMPSAEIAWHLDGESVEKLDSFRVLTETNRSTLVVDAPVRGGRYGVSAGNGIGQPLTQSTTVRFSIEGSNVSQVMRNTSLDTTSESVINSDGITKVVVQKEETIEEHSDSEPDDEDRGDESDANVFIKTFVDPLRVQTEVDTAAVSVEGGEPPLSPLLQRTTTPQPRAMIPSIVSAPEKQIFVPGGLPLVLELRVSSETPCTIRWYYRNFEIRPIVGMIAVDESEPNCCKVIYANPPEGIFKAVVTNEFGMANFETRVLVEFPEGRRSATGMSLDETAPDFMRRRSSARAATPEVPIKLEKRGSLAPSEGLDRAPKLILTPESVYRIHDGDTLTLDARVDAQPEADFQWRQNNFEAHNGRHVRIERIDQNHSRAFFEQPAAGRYEVTATNRLGRDSAATKVIIEFEGRDLDKTSKAERKQIEVEAEKPAEDVKAIMEQTKFSSKVNIEGAKLSSLVMQEEVKDETTNIQKEEESYSLLVKVAESLAQTLVANIFVKALDTAAKRLTDDTKARQVVVGQDDNLPCSDSAMPRITIQSMELGVNEIQAEFVIEKFDDTFECDVIIEIPEESSVAESTKQVKKSDAERHGSAEKSKISITLKKKEKEKEEESPFEQIELKEEEEIQLSDFEQSVDQLAEQLKQLEKDLRETGLSPLPASASEAPATVRVDSAEDFEQIDLQTETVVLEEGSKDEGTLEIEKSPHEGFSPVDLKTPASTIKRDTGSDSRIADSSTPELIDVSEQGPELVESISSEEENFYARQRATLDYPDDMSTSSAEQSGGQPPIFHDTLRDVQLMAGEAAHLKCVVTGTPTPDVDWFVDGDLISDLTNYDIIYEDGVALLRFHSLLPEDEGEYVCEARNSYGASFTKCFVRVAGGWRYSSNALFVADCTDA